MSGTWLTSPRRERLTLALFLLIAFVAYTWANQFPYFYHSDEQSKALQVLHHYRNYWHPMLMLNSTSVICNLFGMDRDPQAITIVGRFIAALCSSIGIAAWMHFAFQRKGFLTGVLTGVFLLALPLLFEVSHYCKEDPALLMGFALTLCAVNAFLNTPDQKHAIYLGLAVGMTISAKYPGVVLIPFGFAVIFRHSRILKVRAVFFLAVAVSLLVINWQWVLHFPDVLLGLEKEGSMLAFGHDGVAGRLPHFQYVQLLLNQHGWPLLIFAMIGWAASVVRNRYSMESILGIMTLLGMAVMGFSPKISERYLLPFMAVVLYLAVVGLVHCGNLISHRGRVLFYAGLIPLVLGHQFRSMRNVVADFRIDSRSQLSAWIGQHLSKNPPIMFSLWTRLPGLYMPKNLPGTAQVDPLDYVADYGSIADFKKRDQRWVVVADVESEKFLDQRQSGSSKSQSVYLRRQLFYQELQREADLLWSAPRGSVYVLNPGLRLYQIR